MAYNICYEVLRPINAHYIFSLFHMSGFVSWHVCDKAIVWFCRQGWHRRGAGGQKPPKDFKKGKNLKNISYFHASKLLKLAFLSILSSLTRKYVLWKGFYHNFSSKKASASGGFAPWSPPRGSAPWTPTGGAAPGPRGSFAPLDLSWRRPCL